jgi:hypothetical protein
MDLINNNKCRLQQQKERCAQNLDAFAKVKQHASSGNALLVVRLERLD